MWRQGMPQDQQRLSWGMGMPQDIWRLPHPPRQPQLQQQWSEDGYHSSLPQSSHPRPPPGHPLPLEPSSSSHTSWNATWATEEDDRWPSVGGHATQRSGHNPAAVTNPYYHHQQQSEHAQSSQGNPLFSPPGGGRKYPSFSSPTYRSPPTLPDQGGLTAGFRREPFTAFSTPDGAGGGYNTHQEQRSQSGSMMSPPSGSRPAGNRLPVATATELYRPGKHFVREAGASGGVGDRTRGREPSSTPSAKDSEDLSPYGQHQHSQGFANQQLQQGRQQEEEGEEGEDASLLHMPDFFRGRRHDLPLPTVGNHHVRSPPTHAMVVSPPSEYGGPRPEQDYRPSEKTSSFMRPEVQQHDKSRSKSGGAHPVSVEVVDDVASQLRTRMLADRTRGVLLTRLVQGTLDKLGLRSFESAGIQPMSVPTFQVQAELERRVNAAIRSYIPGRNVITIYDVAKHIVEQEGVSTFEDLGLGAPMAYPLIASRCGYAGKDGKGLIQITEADVVSVMAEYTHSQGGGSLSPEGFMEFLARKHGLKDPQSLGVRIMDFRNLQGMVPERSARDKDLGPAAEGTCNPEGEEQEPRPGEPGVPRSKVMPRVMEFLEKVSKDEEQEKGKQVENVDEWVHRWNLNRLKVGRAGGVAAAQAGDDSSKGCPYPSVLEERLRQGKLGSAGQGNESAIVISSDEGDEEEEEDFVPVQSEACDNEDAEGWIPAEKLMQFASKWKSVCQESPTVKKVLVKMVKANGCKLPKAAIKKLTRQKSWFRHSPLQEILCIAASSIAAGLWDTAPCADSESKAAAKKKNVGERKLVEAVIRHFVANQPQQDKEKDGKEGRSQEHDSSWSVLRWANECERSLVERYSVDNFGDLGQMSFLNFLVDHADAFPEDMAIELGLKSRPVIGQAKQQQLVPRHRLMRFILHIASVWDGAGEVALEKCITAQLCMHFRVASVEQLGYGSVEELLADATCERQKQMVDASVSYMGTLLVNPEKFALTEVGSGEGAVDGEGGGKARGREVIKDELNAVGVLGSMDDMAAVACLQSAPMLVDLADWSSWQAVFAPSLGPLLDWLEQVDGRAHDLHTLALPNGQIVRVNPSSTTDDFLKSCAVGNAEAAAMHLVSLAVSHGGVSHTPRALLKLHASSAISILLSSFAEDGLQEGTPTDHFKATQAVEPYVHDSSYPGNTDGVMAVAEARQAEERTGIRGENERMNTESGDNTSKVSNNWSTQQRRTAEFVVQCIMAAPAEMRSFVGDVLLPSLPSFVSGCYGLLLHVSEKSEEQTAMLHALGLQMGITEWVDDYRDQVLSKRLAQVAGSGIGSDMHVDGNEYGTPLAAARSDLLPPTSDLKPGVDGKPLDKSSVDEKTSSQGVKMEADQEEMIGQEYEKGAIEKARGLIEMIRVEEFGMDCEMGKTELAKRQNARIGRALKRLSNDLYSKDSHFVLELVQNADDNLYDNGVCPSLYFVLASDRIIVLNNEKGFTERNMRALCDVGNSTKANKGTGFIGEKGIGFKSVFRITDAPEIHSNGFHVKFDIQENKSLGFILPSWLESPALHLKDLVPSDFDSSRVESCLDRSGKCWTTRIDLPLKESIKLLGVAGLGSRFTDIQPSLLLFLHKLRRIDIVDTILQKRTSMIREDGADGMVRVTHDGGSAIWLVSRECFHPEIPRGSLKVEKTEVALAFPLLEKDDGSLEVLRAWQYAFAYLPLRSYGLRFVIQGDFVVPSSREDVDRDSAWNQWLRSKVVDVLVRSVDAFKRVRWGGAPSDETETSTWIATAINKFLAFMPLEGEVMGFFSCLPRMIMSRLRTMAFLPVESEQLVWALPCQVIASWDDLAKQILPMELLKDELGLSLLHRKVVMPESLRASLGIQVYGEKILLQVLRLLLDKDLVKPRGIRWLAIWMAAMYRLLGAGWSDGMQKTARNSVGNCGAETARIIAELRLLPFVPLTDKSWIAVSSNDVWYVPGGSKSTPPALAQYPHITKELRVVEPSLLSCVEQITGDVEGRSETTELLETELRGVKASEVLGLVELLGVKPLSEHGVVECHILPAMQSESVHSKHHEVLLEYMSFIREHVGRACRQCENGGQDRLMDLVRRFGVLVTTGGLKTPAREPVHFPTAMGNLLRMGEILDGLSFPWNKVDERYLRAFEKWQSNKGGAKDRLVQDCRGFLQQLGVTDFVCVREETVRVGRGHESKWGSEKWFGSMKEGQLWSVHDYVSAELEQLLGALCSTGAKNGSDGAPLESADLPDAKRLMQSKVLVETMDQLWTVQYDKFLSASYYRTGVNAEDDEQVGETLSSFAMLLRDKWLIPGNDGRLHPPSSLFEDRPELKQLLGKLVTFATPCIKARSFVKALGLKTDISIEEMIGLFRKFCTNGRSVSVSLAQMARIYSFFRKFLTTHRDRIEATMTDIPSVFVPYPCGGNFPPRKDSSQEGRFCCVSEVWWCDPTGVASLLLCDGDKFPKRASVDADREETMGSAVPDAPPDEEDNANVSGREVGKICPHPIEPLYPDLKDFFVGSGLIRENLSLRGQFRLLERFVATAAANTDVAVGKVMSVFKAWASSLARSGLREDGPEHSAWTMLGKASVFPTVDGNWVTAAECYAPDDEKLCSYFEGHETLQILCLSRSSEVAAGQAKKHVGKAERRKNASDSTIPKAWDRPFSLQELAPFLRAAGVRFISEEAQREIITEGPFDSMEFQHLVVQILFLSVRFIHHLQPAEYRKFVCHPSFMRRIEHLECHEWESLNVKYTLSGVEREVCGIPCIVIQDGEAMVAHKLHTSDHSDDVLAIFEALRDVFPMAVKSSLSRVANLLTGSGGASSETLGDLVLKGGGFPEMSQKEAGMWFGRLGCPAELISKPLQPVQIPPDVESQKVPVEGRLSAEVETKQVHQEMDASSGAGVAGRAPAPQPGLTGQQSDGDSLRNRGIKRSAQDNLEHLDKKATLGTGTTIGAEMVERHTEQWFSRQDDREGLRQGSPPEPGEVVPSSGTTVPNPGPDLALGPRLGGTGISQFSTGVGEPQRQAWLRFNRNVEDFAIHEADVKNTIREEFRATARATAQTPDIVHDAIQAGTEEEEAIEQLGRKGEEFAYRHLLMKYQADDQVKVVWLNQAGETGSCFDIMVSRGDHVEAYIEVKTTIGLRKQWFPISYREWQFAISKGETFHILRVYGIGSAGSYRIMRLSNPAKLWMEGVIKICLAM
ncbi:hypothetical protein CBR_g6414 [Chara braunii]|uniref:Uncharacterized protein n=1 Tax=Chara braunii TaxID=69332 RepID=A0A388KJS3_CHABU|nr:hypothetical protein CBR_g6414 [Chara braunii]|eukprot:GBG70287.1 hypothetical protein CBR_g6414 [Chara braunii]